MNRDAAIQLISAVNALSMYCPPIMFERVVNSPALQAILAVANGQHELAIREPDKKQPPLRSVSSEAE